jgi:hypothetical protein
MTDVKPDMPDPTRAGIAFRIARIALRLLLIAVGGTAFLAAFAYVVITSPPGMHYIRNAIGKNARQAGIDLFVKSIDTDFYSFLTIRDARIFLPGGTGDLVIDRALLHVDMIDLVQGIPGAIQRIEIDGLNLRYVVKPDTTPTPVWSITPFVPWIPEGLTIRGSSIVVEGAGPTQTYAVENAKLTTSVTPGDSVLSIVALIDGHANVESVAETPVSLSMRAKLAGPSLRADSIRVTADGVNLNGKAGADDLLVGPWHGNLSLRIDLAEIPSHASGTDLSGILDVVTRFSYGAGTYLTIKATADPIGTPWARLGGFALYTKTTRQTIETTISCRYSGGTAELTASAPVPERSGPVIAALNLRGVDAAKLPDTPALSATLENINPSGTLNGKAELHGFYRSVGNTFSTSMMRATLDGSDIRASGIPVGNAQVLAEKRSSRVRVDVDVLGVRARMRGLYTDREMHLNTNITIPALDTLLAVLGIEGIHAGLNADITTEGPPSRPNIGFNATITGGDFAGFMPGDLHMSATYKAGESLETRILSSDSLIRAHVAIQRGLKWIENLRADIGPYDLRRLPGNLTTGLGLAGTVAMSVRGSGKLSNPRIEGEVITNRLRWYGQPIGQFVSKIHWFGGVLGVDARNTTETLTILAHVAADSGKESSLDVHWEEFHLGPLVAALTGHELRHVKGRTRGSLTARWKRLVPLSFLAKARMDRLDLTYRDRNYRLLDPPARFDLTKNRVVLDGLTFGDDNQRIALRGAILRRKHLRMTVDVDSLDLGLVAGFATKEALSVSGNLSARLSLNGPLRRPEGSGWVRGNRIRWRAAVMDSLHARISFQNDTLKVYDLAAHMPSGRLHGRFVATSSSLGIPTSGAVFPSFRGSLNLDNAVVIIENWESLRGGFITITGGLDIEGKSVSEPLDYSGTAKISALTVTAPYDRTLRTTGPAIIQIGGTDRPLVEPLRLQLRQNREPRGEILIAHTADTTRPDLRLITNRVSIEDLRHILHPALRVAGIKSLPDDIGGTLSSVINWNSDAVAPIVTASLRASELTGAGFNADSMEITLDMREGVLRIPSGTLRARGDAVFVDGLIDMNIDTMNVRIFARGIDLTSIAMDQLPPLKTHSPPPPLPTTMPLPGFGHQVQYLPPKVRGERRDAPLNTYERLVQRRGGLREGQFAALLPLRADLTIRGPLSKPGIYGTAEVPTAYLELEAIDEPIWFADTARVIFSGSEIRTVPQILHVGAESPAGYREIEIRTATFSLDDSRFDLHALLRRVTFTVQSVQPVYVPPQMWFAKVILKPILTSYYTDPVGDFTADAELLWAGEVNRSELTGQVRLYESTVTMPIANPQDLLKPKSATSLGTFMDNTRLDVSISTEDSLIINNNVADKAKIGILATLRGYHHSPLIKGRVEASKGAKFKYFDREFYADKATLVFPDPDVLRPEADISAHTIIQDQSPGGATYRVDIQISGVAPKLLRTDMTAVNVDDDSDIRIQRSDIISLLLLGILPGGIESMSAQDRINTLLRNTGYAAASTALGSVIPVDRVTVKAQDNVVRDTDAAEDQTEVEIAQSFRLFQQPFTLTIATPISQISALSPARAELQWRILNRPMWFPNLETLSLTVGSESRGQTSSLLNNETTADVDLRLRFR